MILHTFAVIAYGDSPYLEECLDSLRNQTIRSTIYISTSTPSKYIFDIAIKYNVEVYTTKSNLGIAHDWNFSLQQAKTKYVTLAHQDDLYMPDYTENCLNNLIKEKNTLICFTDYIEIVNGVDKKGYLLMKIKGLILHIFMPFRKRIKSRFWKTRFLSFGCPITAPSVMYNLDNLTQFKFSSDYSINLDWDAWLRMARMNGYFIYVKKALLKHRIHRDSATTIGIETNLRLNEDYKMFNRFWPNSIAKIVLKFYKMSYKLNKY